ncbi:hypothetical protein GCM10027048_12440 [Hymenobacter coalescens]
MRTATILSQASLLLLLSGCAAVVPHTLQTPLVQQRGETELALNAGTHGTDVQAAYALTDRLTVLGSAHQRIRGKHGHWAYTGEAGAGYAFFRPGSQRWSLYGGMGYGAGYAFSTFCPDLCGEFRASDRVRYSYAFVQPTYVWMPEPDFALSAAVKITAMRFSRWRTVSSGFDDVQGAFVANVREQSGRTGPVLQPGGNIYVGLSRHFRLNFSSSVFIPLQRDFPSTLGLAAGIGVQYRFGGAPAGQP